VGIENGGNMATIAFSIARQDYTRCLRSTQSEVSVKNCVKSCERFAPGKRESPPPFDETCRANSILATFTQAINKQTDGAHQQPQALNRVLPVKS